jgi:hypothetical protein
MGSDVKVDKLDIPHELPRILNPDKDTYLFDTAGKMLT